jgi:uncharacterized protein YdbL (DUF1318 family)
MIYARHIRLLTLLLFVTGCITVNVYFPAAAAEQAADRIIREIYGEKLENMQPSAPNQDDDQSSYESPTEPGIAIILLDFVVPAAHAQADIDISTPAINKLKASMTQRHGQLKPFYDSGAVGMDSRGLITLRDPKNVAIKDRNTVNQLVAAENQDRNALYAEIARANGHPEWENDIRSTFARRWVANAPGGWYFQDTSGGWKQK